MKNKTLLLYNLPISFLVLISCNIDTPQYIPAPKEVRINAIKYANEYINQRAEYLWGGQDPLPKTIFVDCSGLIIRCYQYACHDYGYKLLFEDTTANDMQNYSEKVTPENGDLIFMGDNGEVSHVALYNREENGDIYFIDATAITGYVSERKYPKDSPKFISFKRMYIEKQND